MTEESTATQEQPNEVSTDVVLEGEGQPEGSTEGEVVEFDDIVLSGQEEPQTALDPRSKTDHILNRVIGRKNKLQDENVRLRQQLQQSTQPQEQSQPVMQAAPDEYKFEDRNQYLQEHAIWQRNMLEDVVNKQLNQQQNGHRVAVQEQEQTASLQKYAESASKLNLPDFNEMQDNAFNVLGDQFAQLIAQELSEDAPKLMYWFGKNPREAERFRDDNQRNPGRTTFSLGKLAANLTIKSKRSNAASPERKIEGASVGGGTGDWQRQYDKLMDAATPNDISKTLRQVRQLKAEAKKAGYDVSTLK